MKTTTTDCQTLLQSGAQVFMVELYTLTLSTGSVVRWTMGDAASVTYGSTTWSRGPLIERGKVSCGIGIQVDSLDVTIYADDTVTVAGVPVLQAARVGALDGAQILIQKGFTDNPANPIKGLVHVAEGRIGDIEVNSNSVKLAVKTFIELLDTQYPIDVYSTSCLNTLYDTNCGVSKSANGLNLTVQSGSTQTSLACGVSGSGVYDLGILVFTSGVNTGVQRAVKAHTSGLLSLSFPLLDAPSVGDAFTVYKGCDKTQATCTSKFGNLPKFRGQPYVPQPETAV